MGKMVLYSFLGVLTLQLGVAVLAACFCLLGVLIFVSNFFAMKISGTVINYIVVGVFVVLLLLAGVSMFMSAFEENRNYAIFSAFVVIVILIFFVITSIIAFLNMPSMTKVVCLPHHRCAEGLWLSKLNYKKGNWEEEEVTGDYTEHPEYDTTEYMSENDTTQSTTETPTSKIESTSTVQTSISTLSTESTPITNKLKRMAPEDEPTEETLIEKEDSKVNSYQEDSAAYYQEDPTVSNISSVYNEIYLDLKKIIKRHIFSMVSYIGLGRESLVKNKLYDRSNQEDDYNKEDEAEDEEGNHENVEEDDEDERGYNFGYAFFMAIVIFLLMTVFFIFTILVLISYSTQLKYIKRFLEDPASEYYLKMTYSNTGHFK